MLQPYLMRLMADSHEADMRRAAVAPPEAGVHNVAAVAEVVIRVATPSDNPSLTALALLDGAAAPTGPALVAEVDGAPGAALPLDGSRPFADPFLRTCELIALLELRAMQLGLSQSRIAPLRRLINRVTPRAA